MTAWPEVAIGDVADFVRGVTFKPGDVKELGAPGTVACLRTSNVQTELSLEDVWAIPETRAGRPDQELRCGDLLVSSANSWNLVGKCSWVGDLPWRATFGGFVTTIRARPDRLDPRYFFRWFSSPTTQAVIRSFGRRTTNISNLNLDRCRRLTFRLPPLEEQRRIAAILDAADGLRAKRWQSLALLDSLTESIFLDMFGDPVALMGTNRSAILGDAVDIVGGGTPSRQVAEYFEGDVCWATSKDMKASFLDDTGEHITPDAIARSATKLVQPGAVLVVVKSKVLAHSLPVAVARVPTCFGQDLKALVPRAGWETSFIASCVRASRRWLLRQARGVNTEGLTLDHLRACPIIDATQQEQQKFAREVDELVCLVGRARQGADGLQELFASLQHRAFRGEL